MGHPGYKWSLAQEGGRWRWRALDRDRGTVFLQGLADSRAEAAAYLTRAMMLGVLEGTRDAAAA